MKKYQPTTGAIHTFKPLTGNRFKCNQTGVITRNPKKYRFAHLKALEGKNPLKGKKSPVTKKVKQWWE